MVIYKITNLVNDKIYIGQTTKSVKQRFEYHCYKSSRCKALFNAIQKYGKENFIIEEICIVFRKEDLDVVEQHIISFSKSLVPFGYNIQKGGTNKDSMRGKIHSYETKKKMSKSATGKNNSQYGKIGKLSPNFGKKKSKEHIEKIAIKHRKKVYCVELNKFYSSLKEAAKAFNAHPSCISNAILGKNRVKRYKGYTFKYIGENHG